MTTLTTRLCRCGALLLGLWLSTGCSQLISNAKQQFAADLSATVLQHDDTETIKQALPAYMVLVSSMIRSDPDNIGLLVSGAQMYGAYASLFTDDKDRKRVLSQRAFDYASHAMCVSNTAVCDARKMPYAQFEQSLTQFNAENTAVLFALGSSWAGLIQASSSDWNAVAELPRAKASIERVLRLDDGFSNGDAHVYMGVMESILPPGLGGKTEQAKVHFEKAIKLSNDTNLMAKVFYAEKYARLIFDRPLHDRLLNEVLAHSISNSDKKLIDILAQARAKKLLANADDYF
jgi:hypothetical protein